MKKVVTTDITEITRIMKTTMSNCMQIKWFLEKFTNSQKCTVSQTEPEKKDNEQANQKALEMETMIQNEKNVRAE